jgi:hypothetical protein
VIGCPLSNDLDVICIVDIEYQSNGKTYPLLTSEIERLRIELESIGYLQEKINLIDINIITIKNGNIASLTKGGKETSNIIMSTYDYHKQKYCCPDLDFVTVDILEKSRTIAKFMIDHLENICVDYSSIRNEKKESYMSTFKMLEFSKKIGPIIDCDNITNSLKWFDDMKSITMKICQLLLLKHNIYEYTKMYECILGLKNLLKLIF